MASISKDWGKKNTRKKALEEIVTIDLAKDLRRDPYDYEIDEAVERRWAEMQEGAAEKRRLRSAANADYASTMSAKNIEKQLEAVEAILREWKPLMEVNKGRLVELISTRKGKEKVFVDYESLDKSSKGSSSEESDASNEVKTDSESEADSLETDKNSNSNMESAGIKKSDRPNTRTCGSNQKASALQADDLPKRALAGTAQKVASAAAVPKKNSPLKDMSSGEKASMSPMMTHPAVCDTTGKGKEAVENPEAVSDLVQSPPLNIQKELPTRVEKPVVVEVDAVGEASTGGVSAKMKEKTSRKGSKPEKVKRDGKESKTKKAKKLS